MKKKKIENFLNPTEIKYIIIHCSDTPNNEKLTAIDIHKMHLNFGWEGIGYHKIICRNGIIQNGRPEFWVGAHTYSINNISLGICLIGKNNFTQKQYSSLKTTLLLWKNEYPNAKIKGHRDAIKTDKTCPNFNVSDWLETEGID